MIDYYAKRAHEYEKLYHRPERQEDLNRLIAGVQQSLAGRSILEIACGTGYWTYQLSMVAKRILATDINEEVLAVARAKDYAHHNVEFFQRDLNNLNEFAAQFDSGFGGFIWSHFLLKELPAFLESFHRLFKSGSRMVFLDNCYVEGSSTPIAFHDSDGNSYQQRKLEDGSIHTVVKNFPSEAFVRQLLQSSAKEIRWQTFHYFWMLSYTL
ncbi:class I SAM-dependent methyltransferase [bacterium]|nr:class I SAM-dependent methyltransferase [bacterium]